MRFTNGLLTVVFAVAVSGCKVLSQPPQVFDAARIQESGAAAYLWTAGMAKQPNLSLTDYAVVIRIDDQVLPPEYRPAAGDQPYVAWRAEVPVGRHLVEILDKELTLACVGWYLLVSCLVTEEGTRVVEFTARSGRAYIPMASDKCGRKWIWIVDAGPSGPDDPQKMTLALSAGLPTVGGESPPEGSC